MWQVYKYIYVHITVYIYLCISVYSPQGNGNKVEIKTAEFLCNVINT